MIDSVVVPRVEIRIVRCEDWFYHASIPQLPELVIARAATKKEARRAAQRALFEHAAKCVKDSKPLPFFSDIFREV